MKPQALLIDLDGVVRLWPRSDERIEIAHRLPVGSISSTAFETDLLRQVITGGISDEEWREQVSTRLGQSFGVTTGSEAVREWSKPYGHPNQEVVDLLNRLDPSLRIVLVTNATSRLNRDLEALSLDKSFYAIVNSSQVGKAKPDSAIFEFALRASSTKAQNALFVDDSVLNVQAAEALGIPSHLFTTPVCFETFLIESGVSLR